MAICSVCKAQETQLYENGVPTREAKRNSTLALTLSCTAFASVPSGPL
jgi:hypothetical protein